MKVSVIIPNYNHAPYLQQRFDSVLQQSFQNFETILLDDFSTDNSNEILEQYRNHPKVSNLLFSEENSGSTFKQWNKGVALSKGDLIWIAESDDSADPDFLKTLVQLLSREPSVGIAYANSSIIDLNGNVLNIYSQEYASWSDRWENDYVNTGIDEVVNFMRFATIILNVSSCLFRKSLFEKVGGANEEFKLSGDWLTYVKMSQHADIAYCAKPLNNFRAHGHTVRSRTKQYTHFLEKLKVLGYIYKHYPITANQKKSQVYSIIAEFVEMQAELDKVQQRNILHFMRQGLLKNVDLLLWKYKVSLLLKKNAPYLCWPLE